jgi:hypothetical protein
MRPVTYQIRVQGHVSGQWAAWFEGLAITNEPDGQATLTGPMRDQAELHGLLTRVRDLNMSLISVRQIPGGAEPE